jgi:hypothetical protein
MNHDDAHSGRRIPSWNYYFLDKAVVRPGVDVGVGNIPSFVLDTGSQTSDAAVRQSQPRNKKVAVRCHITDSFTVCHNDTDLAVAPDSFPNGVIYRFHGTSKKG